MDANGLSVLITGAGGGIGRVLCETFSRAGYRVIGTDRTSDGPTCDHYFSVDLESLLADERELDQFRRDVEKAAQGAPLSALVNNAAMQRLGSLQEMTYEDLDRTLRVNVTAPAMLAKAFLAPLERAQGSIVNIGSIHADLTKPRFVAYATSKSALHGLTRALAVDLGGRVRVNAIAPAAIATEMLLAGFEGDPDSLAALAQHHPCGRIGTPEEIAEAALFLASPRARFLHGTVLGIDGGIGARLHDPN